VNYILGFGVCPDELVRWVYGTDWIKDMILEIWNARGEDYGLLGSVSSGSLVNKGPAIRTAHRNRKKLEMELDRLSKRGRM
jgi:hypothetical protein